MKPKVEQLIRLKELLSAIVQDVRANESAGVIGARFHKTVAEIAVDICRRARSNDKPERSRAYLAVCGKTRSCSTLSVMD